MRKLSIKTKHSIGFCVLLVETMLVAFSFSQNQPAPSAAASQARQLFLASRVHVQLGEAREWGSIIRNEYVPALKKAGVTQFYVWETAIIGETGEFLLSRPIKDRDELDDPSPIVKALGQEGERSLFAKLDRVTASVHTFLIASRPDLGIAPASGYVPKLASMLTTIVAPGRQEDFEKRSKEQLAIMGKTKIKGLLVSRVADGGNPNEYRGLFLFESFADGRQIMTAYSQAASDAKLAPMPAGIITHSERAVYRLVPELSILR